MDGKERKGPELEGKRGKGEVEGVGAIFDTLS